MESQEEQVLQENEVPQDEEDIEQYIEILEEHRKKCEQEGRFLDAQQAHSRIQELIAEQNKRFQKELKQRQLEDRMQIEDAHLMEFNKFNEEWDQKFLQYQEQSLQIEQQTIQKFEEELQKFREEQLQQLPEQPKPSNEILNLKRVIEVLVKRKEYQEAHQVQQKVLKLENEEQEKWEKIRLSTLQAKENVYVQRQQNDLEALRKRIDVGLNALKKQRASELEKMLQRYQNVKKQLTSQQHIEAQKFQNQSKMSLSNSRMMSVQSSVRQTPRPQSKQSKR